MAKIQRMGLFLAVAIACMTTSPLSAGQFLAPSSDLDCTSEIVQLLPCVDFLTNSSINAVVPACCSALSNISSAAPACICELISPANANASAEFNINDTRALELPGMCSVKISPASCSATLAPPAVAAASVALAPATRIPASPPPDTNCTAVTTKLRPCIDFLTDSAVSPSSTCCKKLGKVATSSPWCLCDLATPARRLSKQVNVTRVSELFPLCSVTGALSDCSGVTYPGGPFASIAQPASAPNLFLVIALCLASLSHTLLRQ